MALSYDLVMQFAKITNDNKKTSLESTTYGTVVKQNNANYVQLDGSDLLTPCSSTISVEDGDRVIVQIKNHTATVIGSTSNPSANNKTVVQMGDSISKFNTIVADVVKASDIQAINGYFDNIISISGRYEELDVATERVELLKARYSEMNEITAVDAQIINAEIESLEAIFVEAVSITTEDLEAVQAEFDNVVAYNATFTYVSAEVLKAIKANIEQLDVSKLSADQAAIIYARIQDLQTVNAYIEDLYATKLNAAAASMLYATIEQLTATNANVTNLQTNKLDASTAAITYANISFSNINMAAVQKVFSDSGIIKDLIVQEGKITGELVGVTIKGDLIEGNTIVADKLVVLGSDGLYYKLNMETLGEITVASDDKYQNGLDGSAIIANSVTAEKIAVTDLSAFGATIGGFKISNDSIYSGVKDSINNNTVGIYADKDGQLLIGDSDNFIKYFKDIEDNNTYKLEISSGSIRMGDTSESLDDRIEGLMNNILGIEENTEDNAKLIASAQQDIDSLNGFIKNLVVDENGESLMEQDGDGWVFRMNSTNSAIEALQDLITQEISDRSKDVTDVQSLIDVINSKTAYVDIGTDGSGNPTIILGKEDSDFKVIISNNSIDFMYGSSKPAYINGDIFYGQNVTVKNELKIGENPGYIWQKRDNGNLGLIYSNV